MQGSSFHIHHCVIFDNMSVSVEPCNVFVHCNKTLWLKNLGQLVKNCNILYQSQIKKDLLFYICENVCCEFYMTITICILGRRVWNNFFYKLKNFKSSLRT